MTGIDVFWIAVGLILHTYLGYPFLLSLFTIGRRQPKYAQGEMPTVSLIVAAINEEAVLRDKLENSFALDYPVEKLQIIMVSDGSTDGTDDIARQYEGRPGYLFLRQEQNAGKTTAQNVGVRSATGDVLVFTDANSMYHADALQQLVVPFADTRVGCVCGELRYANPQHAAAGKGEGSYWRYEQFLKRRESLLGSLVGANGAIFALRRELFEELGQAIISDFIMPIRVRRRGYRVVYEPAAIAEEEVAIGFGDEFKRRRRIVARSLYSLWTEPGTLNPFKRPLFAFQVLSHKVIRWLVPLLLLVMLVTSAGAGLARQSPYEWLFGGQILFYVMALLGGMFPSSLGRLSLFYVPTYFCAINLGALLGVIGALGGQRHTVWKPEARPDTESMTD
ncbi:MAG: glycosyltransferase family 2 protein [Candidatus Latescibacteria bacterium]|nr:glycosyl transferase [Gemmatimonadaceae bacterium]MDP6015517.1 glycosyltransferase family 2 protein [Candidatus Latescibacterota bacterium]MDP7448084.1 glycosyltransferase family 2 protein [Candidatus Latescibacterota bacterium]HJP33160.1 glycosyltransferase family 2 protein [Candidatus Latescibacterota bacterium]